VDGIVVEALVEDGAPVEYGQPLIAVLAAAGAASKNENDFVNGERSHG